MVMLTAAVVAASPAPTSTVAEELLVLISIKATIAHYYYCLEAEAVEAVSAPSAQKGRE
jgi:hypothetical protein